MPVVGVVPYMELSIDDEDSLSSRFDRKEEGLIDIAVIRYPRISNFTDLSVLEQIGQVSVRYVDSVRDLHHPDMIVLPGSKNTMADLKWMRENGLEALIKKKAQDTIVFGICGGYQMLGQTISDPYQVESGGSMKGMGLLPAATELKQEKTKNTGNGNFLEKFPEHSPDFPERACADTRSTWAVPDTVEVTRIIEAPQTVEAS